MFVIKLLGFCGIYKECLSKQNLSKRNTLYSKVEKSFRTSLGCFIAVVFVRSIGLALVLKAANTADQTGIEAVL